MVSPAVVDPTAAPAADSPVVTTPDSPVVASPAAVAASSPVEVADPGLGAEAPKPLSLADVSDDDLLAHLRERKNGDGLSLEDRLRKSERDRVESDVRKQAGKRENVEKRTLRFLEAHGIDPSEVTRQEANELMSLYGLAQNDSLGTIGQAWVRATLDEFGVVDRALAEDALKQYMDDPTDIDALASTMLLAVRDTVAKKTLAESSLKDVPEGSKLHGEILAEANRLAAAEIAAQQTTANTPGKVPTAPIGGPGGDEETEFRAASAGQVSYYPADKMARWRSWKSKQEE